jgi:hypothetical protein
MSSPDPLIRAQLAEAALDRMEADMALLIDNTDTLDKGDMFAVWRQLNDWHMFARRALRTETDTKAGAA